MPRILLMSLALALFALLSLPLTGSSEVQPADVPPAQIKKETCKQCKFADCLKNLIKQKEAMIAAYQKLADHWGKLWVDSTSGQPVPRSTVNFTTDYQDRSSRNTACLELTKQFNLYNDQVQTATNEIESARGCGFEFSTVKQLETDSFKCVVDSQGVKEKFHQEAPCEEIYEIALRHETQVHQARCKARQDQGGSTDACVPISPNRNPTDAELSLYTRPAIELTPAGQALEEIAAYQQEIAELKKLLKEIKADKGTLDYDMTVDVTIPTLGTFTITSKGNKWPFTIADDGTISGDGKYSVVVDTSGTKCTISGYNSEYSFKITGHATDEMLNFKFVPVGAQMAPGFRLNCPPGFGFALPVPRMTGEASVEKRDGANLERDLAPQGGGVMKGKGTMTVHLCDTSEK